MPLPSIFEHTVFEPKYVKLLKMELPSRFIRPIHPKTQIAPEEAVIRKVMSQGWWAQPKIHGHRAQIHIPADDRPCYVFNRQGNIHKEALTPKMQEELKRIFRPSKDWSAIDAEWMKPAEQMYVFDYLKLDGKILEDLSFSERYELIPKFYISPHISTIPIFKNVDKCMQYLQSNLPNHIEGLVFRSATTPGFLDSSIVRCRI